MKTIFSETLDIISSYERDEIELIPGFSWSMFKTMKMIEFYSRSRYLEGMKDELGREKPFNNIVNANVDISVAATDVDVKDITLEGADSHSYDRAMILDKLAQGWMRESNFSLTLNDIGETLPRYGGVLVKKTETGSELLIEVVPWKNVVVDQVDIKNGPKVELHWMNAVDLDAKRGSWDDKAIDKAIEMCDEPQPNAPRGKVLVYEVEGVLPRYFLEEGGKGYCLQSHYLIATGKAMVKLYGEELEKTRYKYTEWKKVPGRGLGWGIVEDGEQAQIWTNDAVIQEQNTMELAGKVLVQTASKKYAGRNVLTELDQGVILEHEENKPFTRVDLTPSSLPVWDNLVKRWQQQFDRSSSITDALRGETPPSGQAYRLQALVTQASASQFDYRRENKGIFITEIFYDWVIPFLIKKLNRGGEFMAEFSKEELDQFDEQYINYLTDQKLKELSQRNMFVDKNEVYAEMASAMAKIARTGQYRYLQVPRGFFANIKTRVRIDLTGEQKNKMAMLESLANIFNQIQMTYNPQTGKFAALEDPVLSEIFYSIVEGSGVAISPVTLAAKARQMVPSMVPGTTPGTQMVPSSPTSPESSLTPPGETLPAAVQA